MACDCIKKSQDHILEKLRENHPERQYNSGIFINGGYIFDHKQTILNNVFEAEYTIAGKTQKSKIEKLNILMDYCPFCGKKYLEEAEDDPDTIFDYVRKLNAVSAKKDGSKFTVLLHSNGSPNTLTIWLHMGELKRSIAVGLERSAIVSILKTLTNLYSNGL